MSQTTSVLLSLILAAATMTWSAQAEYNPCGGDCRVIGTAPFCKGSCSDCNHELENCLNYVSCGAGCFAGHKVACCKKTSLTPMRALHIAAAENNLALSPAFDGKKFSECVAHKLGIDAITVLGCSLQCKVTPTCYGTCLGLNVGKILPALVQCGLGLPNPIAMHEEL